MGAPATALHRGQASQLTAAESEVRVMWTRSLELWMALQLRTLVRSRRWVRLAPRGLAPVHPTVDPTTHACSPLTLPAGQRQQPVALVGRTPRCSFPQYRRTSSALCAAVRHPCRDGRCAGAERVQSAGPIPRPVPDPRAQSAAVLPSATHCAAPQGFAEGRIDPWPIQPSRQPAQRSGKHRR